MLLDDYIIFAGSKSGNTVDVIDNNNVVSNPKGLTNYDTRWLFGASNDKYALFGGGSQAAAVDCYDTNLVKTSATKLPTQQWAGGSISIEGFIVFAGGNDGNGATNQIITYDNNLVQSTDLQLSNAVLHCATAKINNYILFAGGSLSSGQTNNIDVFQLI